MGPQARRRREGAQPGEAEQRVELRAVEPRLVAAKLVGARRGEAARQQQPAGRA